jgi:hypothetical protein
MTTVAPRYARVLHAAGEALINIDSHVYDLLAHLHVLGAAEGAKPNRVLDLCTEKGDVGFFWFFWFFLLFFPTFDLQLTAVFAQVVDLVSALDARPRARADELLKSKATYFLIEAKTTGGELPHPDERPRSGHKRAPELSYTPLCPTLPVGFEIKISAATRAKHAADHAALLAAATGAASTNSGSGVPSTPSSPNKPTPSK